MGRNGEETSVMTKRVHLIVSDPMATDLSGDFNLNGHDLLRECYNLSVVELQHVTVVGSDAFLNNTNIVEFILPHLTTCHSNTFAFCDNLLKFDAPSVTCLGTRAFDGCHRLRDVRIRSDATVFGSAFFRCFSLEVIAAAAGFNLDSGEIDERFGQVDPTVGLTRFVRWRIKMDRNKEIFKTTQCMLTLSNTQDEGAGTLRATTNDPIMDFLSGPARSLAGLVLSFKLGVKVGRGDMRKASKAKLLAAGLEMKVLRMETNWTYQTFWGVVVDDEGCAVSIINAIKGGLVNRSTARTWGLSVMMNGNVCDFGGIYGGGRNSTVGQIDALETSGGNVPPENCTIS